MTDKRIFGAALLTIGVLRVHARAWLHSAPAVQCPVYAIGSAFPRLGPDSIGPAAIIPAIILVDGVRDFMLFKADIGTKHAVIVCDSPLNLASIDIDVVPLDYRLDVGDVWSLTPASTTNGKPDVPAANAAQVLAHLAAGSQQGAAPSNSFKDVRKPIASPGLEAVISMVAQGSGTMLRALNVITYSLQAGDREQLRSHLTKFLVGSLGSSSAALASIRAMAPKHPTLEASINELAAVLAKEGTHYRALLSSRSAIGEKKRIAGNLGLSAFEVKFLETLVGNGRPR